MGISLNLQLLRRETILIQAPLLTIYLSFFHGLPKMKPVRQTLKFRHVEMLKFCQVCLETFSFAKLIFS